MRTREALHARMIAGCKARQIKGKSKLDIHRNDILKLISLGVPKTLIAKQFNTTLDYIINKLAISKQIKR